MSIKLSAYDTQACAGFKTADIVTEVSRAYILNELGNKHHSSFREDLKFNYSLVEGGYSSNDPIRFFIHPILFNTGNKDKSGVNIKQLCVDVRNFGKVDNVSKEFIIRNKPEYDFHVNRLILNQLWITQAPEILRDISKIPMLTMASLVSETLGRRFSLDPLEQLTVMVYTCYYYYSCFTDETSFDELEYEKVVGNIIRATKAPSEAVYDALDMFDRQVINGLDYLLEGIKQRTQNQALKNLNVGLLYSVVCNTWFGTNSKEIIAVGLEHIPTWIMVVYASLNETTFKKSVLSKISDRYERVSDNFSHNLKNLLDNRNK
jgi:hypothetical protein